MTPQNTMLDWTLDDSTTATTQGWDLFRVGEFSEIQRIDSPEDSEGESAEPVFPDDYAAMRFVMERYIRGCPVAAKALTLGVFR